MPNKILLADDSMTAQKMGKEILTGAGYEVVAVSNGAAAAKKLADKYAVIILDINMPGYTGFELCEKVRASMDMAKTPVLLTIGKMEHYEPTEVQRVKADGVIIKPFEATDLLATVQKLIEKSVPAQPEYEKTVIMKRSDIAEFKDESYNEWKQESEPEPEPVKKTIEMSHADASAPAFGMDMDEHLAPTPEAPPAATAFAAAAPALESAAPAFEMPTAPLTSVESSNIESLLSPPAPAFEEAVQSVPIAPPTFSSTPSRDPMFEAPANEKSDEYAIPAKDPALAARVEMTNEEFLAKTPAPGPASSTSSTDAEFEARVAAAMSTGYEEAHEIVEAEPEEEDAHAEPAEEIHAEAAVEVHAEVPVPQSTSGMMAEPPDYERTIKIERPADLEISGQQAASEEVEIAADPMIERTFEAPPAAAVEHSEASVPDQLLVEQMQAAVQDMPVAPHVEEPVVEHPAPVETAAPAPAPAATTGHDLELANALAAAVGGESTSTMAAAASASSSRTTSVDHNVIAAAVHRAMTKMMPAIMTEVAKELDPEKK